MHHAVQLIHSATVCDGTLGARNTSTPSTPDARFLPWRSGVAKGIRGLVTRGLVCAVGQSHRPTARRSFWPEGSCLESCLAMRPFSQQGELVNRALGPRNKIRIICLRVRRDRHTRPRHPVRHFPPPHSSGLSEPFSFLLSLTTSPG